MANIWLQFEPISNAGDDDGGADANAYRCRTCARKLHRADAKSAWDHIQQAHRHLYVKLRREEETAQQTNNGNSHNDNNKANNNNDGNNNNNNSNSNATTPKTESGDSGADANERREQINAELIVMVRDNPCLYDKRNEHYKDTAYKARVWEELAARLDMESGKQATLRWKNLGDTYARNRKRQANGANITWPHFSSMAWLEQYRERVETLPTTVDLHRSYDEVLQKFFVAMEGNSGGSTTTTSSALNDFNALRSYAANDDSYRADTSDGGSSSSVGANDDKYAKSNLTGNIVDLASLSAGIFGAGLGGLNGLSAIGAGFGAGFSDIFGNGLLSLAPNVSNSNSILSTTVAPSTLASIYAATTNAASTSAATNASTTTSTPLVNGKNTKTKASSAETTSTTPTTTNKTRTTTKTMTSYSSNGNAYTAVDEPRLKRARKTIDGILYNLNGMNTAANDADKTNSSTAATKNIEKDSASKASTSTNGIDDKNEKINGNSGGNEAKSAAKNGGDAYAACEKLKANGESQLFGALIARKLDDLDHSTRLAAQTEILALLNDKLLERQKHKLATLVG